MTNEQAAKRLKHIRRRARKINKDYDLTKEWFLAKLSKGKCAITNIPFIYGTYDHSGPIPPFFPTIDRRDSNKGYTKDNCDVVIMAYNQIKNEYTLEELLSWRKSFIERYENE